MCHCSINSFKLSNPRGHHPLSTWCDSLTPQVQGSTITLLVPSLISWVSLLNNQLSSYIHMGTIPLSLSLSTQSEHAIHWKFMSLCHSLIDYQLSCHIHWGTIPLVLDLFSKASSSRLNDPTSCSLANFLGIIAQRSIEQLHPYMGTIPLSRSLSVRCTRSGPAIYVHRKIM